MSYLPINAVPGGLTYLGAWNATTNTPVVASGVGNQGEYYVVSVGGTTNLDGEADWDVGDWAVFNGTAWQKIDNSDQFVEPQQIVFSPDKIAPLKQGEYATWAEVMAAFALTFGQVSIFFDTTDTPIGGSGLPEITIPAGAYDFENRCKFTTLFRPNLSMLVVPDAGVTFKSLTSIENGLGLYNTTAAPIISIGGGGVDEVFGIERNAAIASAVGAAPVVSVSNQGVMSCGFGGSIRNLGAPAVRIEPGQTAIIPLFNVPQLEASTIEGDATTVAIFIVTANFLVDLTQPLLLGLVITQYATISTMIAFDPAAAGNQLSSTLVQDALDELTNKHVNRRSTTVSVAGTHSVVVGDPKLIIVDASAIGAGAITVELPAPGSDSGPWKVKRMDSNGLATVEISSAAAALIDGAPSRPLGIGLESAVLETDGTDWYRV